MRLLPLSGREKDIEILTLRHQISVLQRQLGATRPRFEPADRALLAALLAPLPRDTQRRLQLIIRPDIVLRWHRDLIKQRHAERSRHKRPGRPRTLASIRRLVLRLVRENPAWGYRRVHGELAVLEIRVAASTVWQILRDAGIDPAPDRAATTWAAFLRSQAEAIPACHFPEAATLSGQRQRVPAVIKHATRRVRIPGATTHPTAAWVSRAARNLVMDLEDTGATVRYLIRDRNAKLPTLFDEVLTDAGITVVLTGIRMPRMNTVMKRWVRTRRREPLDRTLIRNQAHPLHALRELECHNNDHHPHRALRQAAPLRPVPEPITEQARIIHLDIRRRDRLGGILHEYEHAA